MDVSTEPNRLSADQIRYLYSGTRPKPGALRSPNRINSGNGMALGKRQKDAFLYGV